MSLQAGVAKDISGLWSGLIEKYLPRRDIVLQWHKVLMEYVKRDDAVFAIRHFNNAPSDRYDDLRRGFLTRTSEQYSFFYTDNFFAAYFQKMAMDGFVPTIDEIISAFQSRKFPSRFGRNTSNERALLAVPQGKDPRINGAGFKVAHILNVGKDYYFEEEKITLGNIVAKYFPRGAREDWRQIVDDTGKFYLRELEVPSEARQFLVAQFLRFVHPFNYFLAPQKKFENNSVCAEIAEHKPLLDYAFDHNMRAYGEAFLEYLKLVMPKDMDLRGSNGEAVINIEYGSTVEKVAKPKQTLKRVFPARPRQNKSTDVELAIEYLKNPNTSFRKLESEMMGIESAARGGGFVSKGIINGLGITAIKKGILAVVSIDEELESASGIYRETLITIKHLMEA